MRIFGRGKPKYGGMIAALGLSDWWDKSFTDQEREFIRKRFKPFGAGADYELDRGNVLSTSSTASSYLGGIATWFEDRKYDRIHFILLQECESRASEVFDRHLAYSNLIEYWYRLRDEREGARDQAILYCQRQISISKDAAKAWRKQYKDGMPYHVGFTQLAIIREKDGDYAESIRLSEQAKKDGWSGDWDKRITRLKSKAAKAK